MFNPEMGSTKLRLVFLLFASSRRKKTMLRESQRVSNQQNKQGDGKQPTAEKLSTKYPYKRAQFSNKSGLISRISRNQSARQPRGH